MLETALRRWAAAVEEQHAALTRLDELSGDGDFGDNLRDATRRVVRRLDATTGADDGAAADLAAAVFLDEVGGTSGPLFGLLLQDVAAAVHEDADVVAAVAVGLLAGLAAVQRVGEAERGDRADVDALHAAMPGLDAADLAEATRAAETTTAATYRVVARIGRASYVGERGLGAPDPGCVGVCLLLWALAGAADPAADLGTASELVARCEA
ncbi:dihydroxyacetone kinase subunit DhaL [Angustibacter aerolatus]